MEPFCGTLFMASALWHPLRGALSVVPPLWLPSGSRSQKQHIKAPSPTPQTIPSLRGILVPAVNIIDFPTNYVMQSIN